MLPDGIKAASPKAKSQPRKDFLARNELDLSALNARREIYRKRNEPDKAVVDFTKAIKINSKFPPPYMSRGLILLSQSKDAEADADFTKYLQMFPNGKDALDKQIADVKAKRTSKP